MMTPLDGLLQWHYETIRQVMMDNPTKTVDGLS